MPKRMVALKMSVAGLILLVLCSIGSAAGRENETLPGTDVIAGSARLLMGETLHDLLYERTEFVGRLLQSDRDFGLLAALLSITCGLTGFYGLAMGLRGGFRQALASAVKTPLLFLLSLAICLPLLFVVNILLGADTDIWQTIGLLLFALSLNAILLGSCALISGFFGIGSDYHFMKLLHVAIFGLCALYSMHVLYEGLRTVAQQSGMYPRQALRLFQIWVLVYGFVGTQMAWMLRPFLGEPGKPFELFRRHKEGLNFYTAVWVSVRGTMDRAGHSSYRATTRSATE